MPNVNVTGSSPEVGNIHFLELKEANEGLQKEIEGLRRKIAELSEQAVRDPLTGLYNRRFLDEMLPRTLSQAQRLHYPVTAAMADIDRFKELNDSYGHQAGDVFLKGVAAILQTSGRTGDIACRFGGEEFLLVFPGMQPEDASRRLGQVRDDVAKQYVTLGQQKLAGTLSIGVASYPVHADSAQGLISAADKALYRAKNVGRNRVCIYGSH